VKEKNGEGGEPSYFAEPHRPFVSHASGFHPEGRSSGSVPAC
jgi:hypothetical protein